MNFAAQALEWDLEFLKEQIRLAPVDPPPDSISNWIQGRRMMPSGTPFPGFWNNAHTPYLIQLMNMMSPSSHIHHIAFMKAAQMGATAVMENVMAFYMGAAPTSILYCAAIEEALKKWSQKRLDPLIETCGLRHLMSKGLNNKSGDKVLLKLFVGGDLNMASLGSAAALRSDAIRLLIRDEVDGTKESLDTGEGSCMSVSEARTESWGDRAKIFDLSTPSIDGHSAIQKAYLRGDRRKFYVPCPRCGAEQVLEWGSDKESWGMRAEKVAGELKYAYYLCKHCHDPILNIDKEFMLPRGEWRPTSKSQKLNYLSYQISGLYRPVGMKTWTHMWEKYEDGLEDEEDMRSFVNLQLGECYKETGSRPKVEHVIELKSGYKSGTIPDGVLFLTAAVDVQVGSKKDPANPPRLEMEICGHGKDWRTSSISYHRIEGAVDDETAGAWLDLTELMDGGGFEFKRDDGLEFGVNLTAIDSGTLTEVVYAYCKDKDNVHPIKGFHPKQRKPVKGDPNDPVLPGSHHHKYRITSLSGDVLLHANTVRYKDSIYKNLAKKWNGIGLKPKGFCEFPNDYPKKYFDMLTSEVKIRRKGRDAGYDNQGRRNESLDCRVYNLCAADVFLKEKIDAIKAYYLGIGTSKEDLAKIDYVYLFEALALETTRLVG